MFFGWKLTRIGVVVGDGVGLGLALGVGLDEALGVADGVVDGAADGVVKGFGEVDSAGVISGDGDVLGSTTCCNAAASARPEPAMTSNALKRATKALFAIVVSAAPLVLPGTRTGRRELLIAATPPKDRLGYPKTIWTNTADFSTH